MGEEALAVGESTECVKFVIVFSDTAKYSKQNEVHSKRPFPCALSGFVALFFFLRFFLVLFL